jgi:hypothetical protein
MRVVSLLARRHSGTTSAPRIQPIAAVELDPLVTTRKDHLVFSSAPDGKTPEGITASNNRKWTRWTGFWRRGDSKPAASTDALVAAWKTAWMHGAQAAWRAMPSGANPHATGQERSAWDAGWRWAQQHPDRRTHGTPRLAHRHRRANDSTPHLTRALQIGAVGVTAFWVSRALHRWSRSSRRES